MIKLLPAGWPAHWRAAMPLGPTRLLAPFVAIAMIAVLARQLSQVDLPLVLATVASHSALTWILALGATWASFRAIGRCDVVIHRALGTGVTAPRAAAIGMRAVAVAQVAGFGLATGSLARWRGLPEMSLSDAAKVTALVAGSFLASLAVLVGLCALTGLGDLPPALGPYGAILLSGAVAVLAAAVTRRRLRVGAVAALLSWVALDTGFAALTLWLFLPPEVALPAVFAAYLAALAAGLLSSAPGGVGAFELTLLALLPAAAPGLGAEAVLSAILAHRLVYYLIPALCALPGLVGPRPPTASALIPVRADDLPPPDPVWNLRHQGARVLARPDRSGGWLVRPAPFCLVVFGPSQGRATLADARDAAARLGRIGLFYKLGAGQAAIARRQGLSVVRVAVEAIVDPRHWSTAGTGRTQLRRKLRQADRAGVEVAATDPRALPLEGLIRVNAAWTRSNGREKGFSMGRFSPGLVARQAVFVARCGGRIVAFATFGTEGGAWSLDLMRQSSEAPPGTMHSLIVAAIGQARNAGATRLSLAAVPDTAFPFGRLGRDGLHQFKAAFDPVWLPRYAAARNPVALAFGLLCVAWAIHRPHDQVENFGFELRSGPWQGICNPSTTPGPVSHARCPDQIA